jgi:hypothetical protein
MSNYIAKEAERQSVNPYGLCRINIALFDIKLSVPLKVVVSCNCLMSGRRGKLHKVIRSVLTPPVGRELASHITIATAINQITMQSHTTMTL